MSKFEDIIAASKVNELLHKKEDEKVKTTILWVLAIIGVIAAVAGIAYAVYCFFTPDYLEDFDEDFEDDFDDDEFFGDGDEVQKKTRMKKKAWFVDRVFFCGIRNPFLL